MKRFAFLAASLLTVAACQTVPAPADPVLSEPAAPEQTEAPVVTELSGAEAEQLLRYADLNRADADALRAEADILLSARESMENARPVMEDGIQQMNDAAAGMEDGEEKDALLAEAEDLKAELSDLADEIVATDTEIETKLTQAAELEALADRQTAEAEMLIARAEAEAFAAEEAARVAELEAAEAEAALAAEALAAEAVVADAEPTPAETAQTEQVAEQTVTYVTFLDYRNSELVRQLLSQELLNDDVAIMGVISGARKYCGLNWEPGFVEFIQLANRNGYDLGVIAEEHGLFMGGATKNLRASGYQCIDEDLVGLRAINPY